MGSFAIYPEACLEWAQNASFITNTCMVGLIGDIPVPSPIHRLFKALWETYFGFSEIRRSSIV